MNEMLSVKDLDLVRRCMLRSPISKELDALVVLAPVNRCLALASIVMREVEKHRELKALLLETNFLDHIKAEAMARQIKPEQFPNLMPLLSPVRPSPC